MEHIRNKLGWGLSAALALLLLAALAGVVHGGPLDPTGPPGSTGKNVITALPFTISQPGSYVLNGNLTCTACSAGQDAITVTADNVTIDLQGFQLVGVTGVKSGISSGGTTPRKHWTIRNGTIDGFSSSGIYAVAVSESTFEDLTITNIAGDSAINAKDGVTVRNVTIDNIANYGMRLGKRAVVSDCYIEVSGGSAWGIDAKDESMIEGCNVSGNLTAGGGIQVTQGSTIQGCAVSGFTVIGIQVASATVTGCSVDNVSGPSLPIGILATSSLVESNSVAHIVCDSVSGCPNQAQAIYANGDGNRIRSNQISSVVYGGNTLGAAYAIYVGSVRNTVSGNSFTGALYGVSCSPAPNDCAPTGQASTSTNPWINVSY